MTRLLGLCLALCAGCVPAPTPPPAAPPRPELGAEFDAARCGAVAGQVRWSGEVPGGDRAIGAVPHGEGYRWREVGNPFRPQVDPATGGVAGVLVWLTQVDPARSKPWDHAPVSLELVDFTYLMKQGECPTTGPGIVRRGDGITVVSRDPELHTLRGRGASFFSLVLPAPDRPRTWTLDTAGVVELTSGSGYFWNALDLFVCDHPYCTTTDAAGRFELPTVPDGDYELTARLRNPTVIRVERDPETGLPFRRFHAPAAERTSRVTVSAGQAAVQDWAFDARAFSP